VKRLRLSRWGIRNASLPHERWGVVVLILSALVLLSVVPGSTIASAGTGSRVRSSVTGTKQVPPLGKANPVITRTPQSTPTPNPNILLNQRQGCAAGTPKPIAYVIHGGSHKGKGTAPSEVALTFDDGPSTYSSLPIIQYLERTHTPATFFVEGQYARLWPNLLRREWLDGFAIGMHSWNHPYMTRVSYQEREHQFGDTKQAIENVLGKDACLWFWRPPYMDLNTSVFNQAQAHGFTTIEWNDDSRDWSRPGVRAIVNTVLAEATRAGIILFHDGPALRDQTAAALPLVLAGLKQRGLKPVTIPQLLADSGYPGVHLTNNVARVARAHGRSAHAMQG
jgi:peptidoglycan/xylan/chitin deacetylase (PgdA/CDA1 family)